MDTLNWASQMQWLFTLSIPLACIAWTITHEEIFREPRELCVRHSKQGKTLLKRKFFYLFTCEYCFSHYVAILILLISDFKMIFTDWRGYFVAGFSLVWISNIYMAFFSLLRFGIKKEKIEISVKEEELKNLPGK
jgi:hypothetical protein